jgi:hypothetical protein
MYKHGENHENCWRDCERHPNLECFVFVCPDRPAPEYDCQDAKCQECDDKLIFDSVPCKECDNDICGACCQQQERDIIGVYLESSLICVACSKEGEGEQVTAEAVPDGFTCDECGVTQNA